MTASIPGKVRDIVKNAPNALIYSVAFCFVVVIAAFVVLAATGASSTDLRSFLNTLLNIASVLLGGGSLIAAGAAAKSAGKAEQQTNGALDERIISGAKQAIVEHEQSKVVD